LSEQYILAKFIEQIPFQRDEHILLFFSEPMTILSAIAAQVSNVTISEVDFAQLKQLQTHPKKPDNVHGLEMTIDNEAGQFTKAMIDSPKGRMFARFQLWRAYSRLQENGQLYLMGANDEGIKSVIADTDMLYSHVRVLAYKKGHRLAAATKSTTDQAFPVQWGDDPAQLKQILLEAPLGTIWIAAAPGVFSGSELDKGTEFLLSQPDLQHKSTGAAVLDVGCGSGVIGASLARFAETVHMVDSNLLAVHAARMTVQLNGLTNAQVYASDVYSEVGTAQFDLIVSNPPFHQGFNVSKTAAHTILQEADAHLRPGGEVMIVANAFLPYEDHMRPYLNEVRVLDRNPRYKVLIGTKR
jgi:16S rRNA (guanine1207-N2)-methyltransferase